MKRQRARANYTEFNDNDVQLTNNHARKAVEHSMEATVLEGDTLASIALRFNCTVADLKRLNKIDKDNEIFARKILKIPITPHNVLLDTLLPTVHKSGNSSPKMAGLSNDVQTNGNPGVLSDETLGEKLIVASISNTTYTDQQHNSIPIIETTIDHDVPDASDPLLMNGNVVLAKPKVDFSFNGSDCDMNWLCLFVCILALCFAIPLIYVYFIYEEKVHPEHFHHITTQHNGAGVPVHPQHAS